LKKPWVFFDLGNTVVDTRTYDFKKIFYRQGSYEYLLLLRSQGYKLGLIVNVPDRWGSTDAEKVLAMKQFIAESWTDPRPMNWEIFDAGIVIPHSDALRKPEPEMFQRARELAAAEGCGAVYQGEELAEVEAATRAGLYGFLVEEEFMSEREICSLST